MRAVDGVLTALADGSGDGASWLVGEPCVPPPEVLGEALARAARANRFPYPPPAGLPGLRRVVAGLHAEAGKPPAMEQVVITTGAKGGLLAVMAALLEPGDELIHPLPCYPAYRDVTIRLGARPVTVAERGGSFDGWPQAVAERIGPRTRAVIVASPSNPTGATLSTEQARDLVAVCRHHGVRLICDEAYAEYRFGAGPPRLPADFDPDRNTVVQIRSASKSWALCGWRVGWVLTDTALAGRVAALHAAFFNPAAGPTQEALISLPEVPTDYLASARAAVRARIESLTGALASTLPSVDPPAGGFYLWLDVGELMARRGLDDAEQLCTAIAREYGIGLWPGTDFGSREHVRIAVTAPTEAGWESACGRLRAALT